MGPRGSSITDEIDRARATHAGHGARVGRTPGERPTRLHEPVVDVRASAMFHEAGFWMGVQVVANIDYAVIGFVEQ